MRSVRDVEPAGAFPASMPLARAHQGWPALLGEHAGGAAVLGPRIRILRRRSRFDLCGWRDRGVYFSPHDWLSREHLPRGASATLASGRSGAWLVFPAAVEPGLHRRQNRRGAALSRKLLRV